MPKPSASRALSDGARPLSFDELTDDERSLLRRLCERLRAFRDDNSASPTPAASCDQPPRVPPWFRPEPSRTGRILLLDAPRGGGKTSLMLTLVEALARDADGQPLSAEEREVFESAHGLVRTLRPLDLDPDPGDNLYGLVLAAFKGIVDWCLTRQGGRANWGAPAEPDPLETAWGAVEEAALLGSGTERGPARPRVADPYEAQSDGMLRLAGWQELGKRWRHFVDCLLRELEQAAQLPSGGLLLLPVDDLDLHPGVAHAALQALRVLYHPRLVFLVTADSRRLKQLLHQSRLEQERKAAGGEFEDQVVRARTAGEAIYEKLVPQGQVFQVEQLSILQMLILAGSRCAPGDDEALERRVARAIAHSDATWRGGVRAKPLPSPALQSLARVTIALAQVGLSELRQTDEEKWQAVVEAAAERLFDGTRSGPSSVLFRELAHAFGASSDRPLDPTEMVSFIREVVLARAEVEAAADGSAASGTPLELDWGPRLSQSTGQLTMAEVIYLFLQRTPGGRHQEFPWWFSALGLRAPGSSLQWSAGPLSILVTTPRVDLKSVRRLEVKWPGVSPASPKGALPCAVAWRRRVRRTVEAPNEVLESWVLHNLNRGDWAVDSPFEEPVTFSAPDPESPWLDAANSARVEEWERALEHEARANSPWSQLWGLEWLPVLAAPEYGLDGPAAMWILRRVLGALRRLDRVNEWPQFCETWDKRREEGLREILGGGRESEGFAERLEAVREQLDALPGYRVWSQKRWLYEPDPRRWTVAGMSFMTRVYSAVLDPSRRQTLRDLLAIEDIGEGPVPNWALGTLSRALSASMATGEFLERVGDMLQPHLLRAGALVLAEMWKVALVAQQQVTTVNGVGDALPQTAVIQDWVELGTDGRRLLYAGPVALLRVRLLPGDPQQAGALRSPQPKDAWNAELVGLEPRPAALQETIVALLGPVQSISEPGRFMIEVGGESGLLRPLGESADWPSPPITEWAGWESMRARWQQVLDVAADLAQRGAPHSATQRWRLAAWLQLACERLGGRADSRSIVDFPADDAILAGLRFDFEQAGNSSTEVRKWLCSIQPKTWLSADIEESAVNSWCKGASSALVHPPERLSSAFNKITARLSGLRSLVPLAPRVGIDPSEWREIAKYLNSGQRTLADLFGRKSERALIIADAVYRATHLALLEDDDSL